jgi:hypothetical protein
MSDTSWIGDFTFARREVTVKKTGAVIVLNRNLAQGVARWASLYLAVQARRATNLFRPAGPRVWFTPDRPRPWYLVGLAATWSGVRFAEGPDRADAAFYFEDATRAHPPRPRHARAFNFDCGDVSKSHVAEVFEQVFGYPLRLDPRGGSGPCVEKGEGNGAHDGRVVQRPLEPRPGKVYQRLIDNVEGDEAIDLRTPFVGGRPVCVFLKRRPVATRFGIDNNSVALLPPDAVFSPDEIARLSGFAHAMKLDWGGLDILRDAPTGRLYVVDVNKTDMPPLALPFRDKVRAIALLADALRDLIEKAAT